LVRISNLPPGWVLDERAFAVNCHLPVDVSDMTLADMRAEADGKGRRYVTELHRFAAQIAEGDLVVGVDTRKPKDVLIATVSGAYVFMPVSVGGCHHRRDVREIKAVCRDEFTSRGVRLPGLSVKAVAELDLPDDVLRLASTQEAPPPRPERPKLSGDRTAVTRVREHTREAPARVVTPGRKIVLSRKGFDAAWGGKPSPILPDGRLVSLPIPDPGSGVRYSDIAVPGVGTAYDLLSSLGRTTLAASSGPTLVLNRDTEAHLDPDLVASSVDRAEGWRPIFGQEGAAAGHLRDQQVGKGDLFLFYGWYQQTVVASDGRRLRRAPGAPDLHVLFGWLEVGDIWRPNPSDAAYDPPPTWAGRHPHVRRADRNGNILFGAADRLTAHESIPGAGVFDRYSDRLRLTQPGMSRSHWCLPAAFRDSQLSYHTDRARWSDCETGVHLRTTSPAQEFVQPWSAEVANWVVALLDSNRPAPETC
jgi:hypothetical protein